MPLVWVFVKDQTGTHRDEYFYSTDVSLTAVAMIAGYCGRWNLEKEQTDCTSSDRWCVAAEAGYHRCRRAA